MKTKMRFLGRLHVGVVSCILLTASDTEVLVQPCRANDLAIYTVAPRFGAPPPSEMHQFTDDGGFVQRWAAPETRHGVSMTSDGSRLYIAELASFGQGGAIETYSLEGAYLGQLASFASQVGNSFAIPSLESDNAGDFYVTYRGNGTTEALSLRLDSTGTVSETFSHPALRATQGIDAAADGSVYIVTSNGAFDEQLFKFNAQGTYIDDFPLPQLNSPSDLAIHEASNELFITDEFGDSIHVFDISTPTPTYTGPIPVPNEVTEIDVEPTTGRIFGTSLTTASAFEVSRNGDLLTTFVPFPAERAIQGVVAVAIPEPSELMGIPLLFFVSVLSSHCLRRRS